MNLEFRSGPGPIRNRGRERDRGAKITTRGRGARGGGLDRDGGVRRAGARDTPTAKSLADLDKELEAFMGGGKETAENGKAADGVTTNAATEDVAMV